MLLSVRDLAAGYGRRVVVQNITLEVGRGEIVSVLGPNGAGKSTTLRALSGIASVFAGEIRFDGTVLNRLSTDARARLGLGHVPEGRGILGKLTVRENLRLGLAASASRGAWSRKLDEVTELFPVLREYLELPAGNLSGGEQQMLTIGRALTADPKLLMIDEMSFGLAPGISRSLLEAIAQLRNAGRTFLLVDQDAMALRYSDRTYVIRGGEVRVEEDSSELLRLGRDRLAEVYLGVGAPASSP